MIRGLPGVSFKLALYCLILSVVALLLFSQFFIGLTCSHNNQPLYSKENRNSSNTQEIIELQQEQFQEDQNQLPAQTFLFIGVLSKGAYHARRFGVRLGWANQANKREDVIVKFLLTDAESDGKVQQEQSQFGDVILIPNNYSYSGNVGYRDIFIKVVYMFDYALKSENSRFIMKTDDDAYINVPGLVSTLKQRCETPDCAEDRLYVGHMFMRAQVITNPKHKWFDGEYMNHTGLQEYPPYAQGGGYLLTRSLVQEIMFLYNKKALIETPIEDANIGFWLTAIRHTRLDMDTFWSWGDDCCGKRRPQNVDKILSYNSWKQIVKRQSMPPAAVLCPLQIQKQVLVLHKITNPQLMKLMGQLFAACQYVNDFQRQCLNEDGNKIVCQNVDIWDLCIMDPKSYGKFCTSLKTKRQDFQQRFTDEQLNRLQRPFNVSDVERVFETFQKQLQAQNQAQQVATCSQHDKNCDRKEIPDLQSQINKQDSIKSMIVLMMESLKQINYTVQENSSNITSWAPALEAIKLQLGSLPGSPKNDTNK